MNVSVYLGSSTTCLETYNSLAFSLGRRLALAGHTVVYGGSDVGTMKYLADGVQSASGYIVGVFPQGFRGTIEVQKEGFKVFREGLDETVITADFSERKQVMENRSDCCIVMPGSFGTLDELFTYACNYSIGKHEKPIYILNHEGYYEPLKQLISNMRAAGFLKPSAEGALTFCDSIEDIPLF